MKKSLLLFALLGFGLCAHAQIHTGPYYSFTAFPFKMTFGIEPRLHDIKPVLNVGWHREKWLNATFFRTWNVHAERLDGQFSNDYERNFYKYDGIKDGNFSMLIVQTNWNLGRPILGGEIDDPFIWYVVGGLGFSYLQYDGEYRYRLPGSKNASFTHVAGHRTLPNLNVGVGMELRMGRRWYLNMLANAEYTTVPRFVISARLLRKKHFSGGFWKHYFSG